MGARASSGRSGAACADAVAWSAAGGTARGPAAVLGGDRPRAVSEDAGVAAGVSPAVGSRWFRQGGGMPSTQSGSAVGALSVVRRARGDRRPRAPKAVGCARSLGRLGRSAVDDLAGAAPQRRDPWRPAGVSGHDRAVARRAACRAPEGGQARRQPARCGSTCRTGWRAGSPRPTARRCRARRCAGSVAVTGAARTGAGRRSWSPEQIANRLRVDFPDDGSMRISHEAIYQALYVQGRGALRRELTACLRTGRALRVPRARTRGRGKKFVSPEILISERPAEADDRAVPGTLGRRPDPRAGQLRDRDPGRAHHPVHDAAAPAPHGRPRRPAPGQERPRAGRARRRGRPRRHRRLDHDPARAAAPVADLGPGRRDGPARPAAHRHRPGDLLLRPAQPLAARHQREHQRPAAPVLPQGHRPQQAQPRRPRRRRRRPQQPTPQDPRLEDPRRGPRTSSYSRSNKAVLRRPLEPGLAAPVASDGPAPPAGLGGARWPSPGRPAPGRCAATARPASRR